MAVTSEMLSGCGWETSLLRDVSSYAKTKQILHDQLCSSSVGIHLAVLNEPFLSYILEGKKTVESRFGVKRAAPYGRVESGDILLLKACSGPIVAVCRVDYVWFYELAEESLAEVKRLFSTSICAFTEEFWDDRARANFATLMRIKDVVPIEPISCDKRDRRGWVVLQSRDELPFAIEGE